MVSSPQDISSPMRPRIPVFDDTTRSMVSSPQDISGPPRPIIAVFDNTTRSIVSSPWGFPEPPRPRIPVFDDTMRRIVSSLQGFSGPPRPRIPVFDDTTRSIVSSPWGTSSRRAGRGIAVSSPRSTSGPTRPIKKAAPHPLRSSLSVIHKRRASGRVPGAALSHPRAYGLFFAAHPTGPIRASGRGRYPPGYPR